MRGLFQTPLKLSERLPFPSACFGSGHKHCRACGGDVVFQLMEPVFSNDKNKCLSVMYRAINDSDSSETPMICKYRMYFHFAGEW